MRPNRPITIISLVLTVLIYASSAFAQNRLDVPGGDIQTPSLGTRPIDSTAEALSGANEGKVCYDTSTQEVYLSRSGDNWGSIVPEKNIASVIVAVDRNLDNIVDAGDSLNPNKADFVCDGSDDQVQIQQAIDSLVDDAVTPNKIPGAIYLLEGTYNINGTINLSASGRALIGTGNGTVLQVASLASLGSVIRALGIDNILISQLKIDGNSRTGASNTGISFSNVSYSTIDKVWVADVSYNGINISGGSYNIVSDSMVEGCGRNGIKIASSHSIVSGNDCRSNGVITPVDVENCGILVGALRNIIYGNLVRDNANAWQEGIVLNNTYEHIVSNNMVQGNGAEGILIQESRYNVISGNQMFGNNVGVGGGNADLNLDSTSGNCYGNVVSGNRVTATGQRSPMYMTNASSNVISNNYFYYSGGFSIDAFVIRMSSDNNLISSNLVYDSGSSGGRGIRILGSDCDNNYLMGNIVNGGFGVDIQDNGTGTVYTSREKINLERSSTYYLDGNNTLYLGYKSGSNEWDIPTSYLVLSPTSSITLGNGSSNAIVDGKAAGDLLILENDSATYSVTVPDNANTALSAASHELGQYDTLELIWSYSDDGDASNDYWVEVGWADYP